MSDSPPYVFGPDNTDAGSSDPASGIPLAHLEVDASGLKCPLPILRAKKALAQLESGQVLKVITTDTHAERDFQAFARQTGNALLGQVFRGQALIHWIQRR